MIKSLIKKTLERNGFEIRRYPDADLARRLQLLKTFQINLVLDIGANTGQYASQLLNLGFGGRVISFEPLSSAYRPLAAAAEKNNNWDARNMAIGNMDGEIEINISENSYSSSILPMLDNHLENAPNSRYIDKEKVAIHKLDTLLPQIASPEDKIYLKIDTQGYEKNVLEGAAQVLDRIAGIQLEMSLVPLYGTDFLYQDVLNFMQRNGFSLYSIETGFSSPHTGQLLQADGIFFRNNK